jgi:hypothetical protein
MKPLGIVGLAIAGNVAIGVQGWYLQANLARKYHGLAFHHLLAVLAKVVLSAVVMGGVVAVGWWGWSRSVPPTKIMDGLGVAALIGLGVGIYGGALWILLGPEQRAEILALLRRRSAGVKPLGNPGGAA